MLSEYSPATQIISTKTLLRKFTEIILPENMTRGTNKPVELFVNMTTPTTGENSNKLKLVYELNSICNKPLDVYPKIFTSTTCLCWNTIF